MIKVKQKTKLISVIFLFALCNARMLAQEVLSSSAYVQTCLRQDQCFSINSAAYIFYDESKNSFYLKIDFQKFKSGQDSLDDWLDDLTSTFLYLVVPLDKELFKGGMGNHNNKIFSINAQAYLNNIWHDQKIGLTLMNKENGLLNTNTNGNNYDNFRIFLSLAFGPKDFKLQKKPHHLKKTIYIGVASGRINLLQPGMEKLLEEAYDHH